MEQLLKGGPDKSLCGNLCHVLTLSVFDEGQMGRFGCRKQILTKSMDWYAEYSRSMILCDVLICTHVHCLFLVRMFAGVVAFHVKQPANAAQDQGLCQPKRQRAHGACCIWLLGQRL